MDTLQNEDGQFFIRSLAQFIRQHEKALANSLQLSVHNRPAPPNLPPVTSTTIKPNPTNTSSANPLASALSFAGLNFMSHSIKAAHLTLTPHHLFYLLSRIEELGIAVGPMNVRIESINMDLSPTNYISFLQAHNPPKGRTDSDSIHSVSSVRSVMSGMSAFWSTIGLGSSASKTDKARAATESDLKYLYSAFTKLPSLRLTSDHRARLIRGYEEFPFDTAVPLFAFKNVQHLEIIDMDFRQFHGWDRLADQLCLLTIKRGNLDDPTDLLTNIVLDDAEKRRRRATRGASDAPSTPSWSIPSTPRAGYARSHSDSGSPGEITPGSSPQVRDQAQHDDNDLHRSRNKGEQQHVAGSVSPKRPNASRPTSSYRHVRTYSSKVKRSGSGSSNCSDNCVTPQRSESSPNLLTMSALSSTKWQRLKYLSLADNALTTVSARSIAPIATTLRSFNLSANLFTEIPDSLSTLTRLTSLDLSNCMIESLQSLSICPLTAITTLKLKANRLQSLAGIEKLLSLENLNVQDNMLSDPMEAARLTNTPNLRRIWVKHNPFTKKYADYRVKIMNVFRQTPGYVEDIIIDDQSATYSERKQLVDRVPEIERLTTEAIARSSKPPVVMQRSVQDAARALDSATRDSEPVHHNELSSSSTRRRKGPRRRIVDLAREDEPWLPPVRDVLGSPVIGSSSHDLAEAEPVTPGSDVHSVTANDSGIDLNHIEGDSLNLAELEYSQEDYRSKIEALRQQFGNNWLSALSEQKWQAGGHHYDHKVNQPPPAVHHVNSHAIVSGGRSLG